MRYLPFLCSCLLLTAALPASAELYQWKDAQGRTHFSDRKPDGNGTVTTLPQAKPVSTPKTDAPSQAERQERLRALSQAREAEREEQEAEARRREETEQKKQEACREMKDYLASLEGRRVYVLDEKGQRVFVDDATRDAGVAAMERQYREHCP